MPTFPPGFADLMGAITADVAPVPTYIHGWLPATEPPKILPLPDGMRAKLLALLDDGYPEGGPQCRLGNAPDGAIAWQVQSMLDDYANEVERIAFGIG